MFWKREKISLETRFAETVLQHSPDGMLLVQNGRFTMCNAAAERVYRRSRYDIIGKSTEDFSAPIQQDGRPAAAHGSERMAEAQRDGFSRFEWTNLDPEGRPLRMLVTLVPVAVENPGELLVLVQSLAETAEVVDALRHGLEELSRGNLTCHLDQTFRSDYECLRTAFNTTVDAFASSMTAVDRTAQSVEVGAAEIRAGSEDLSSRTEQQAASVEEAVAALRQITDSVQHSAQEAVHANAVVTSALTEARQSGDVVARAIEAMATIERSSQEIAEIVNVIDGIAFQTNLLALNAGVEAARAGDAGKGFAVVASEVRALAQRAADAAKDIRSRIGASTEQVTSGVSLVTETGSALERIATSVGEISEVMGRLSGTSESQVTMLMQVNATVTDMDAITQQNAAMAEQATATARSLADLAGTLTSDLAKFRGNGNPRGRAAAPTQAPAQAAATTPAPARSRPAAVRKVPAPASTPAPRHAVPAPAAARALPSPRASGNTALARDDDWSEF